MERKSQHKKSTKREQQESQDSVTSYKNENVLFKIHSPRGEQNYNGKIFPAKFSINICNEPVDFSSSLFNRQNGRATLPIPDVYPLRKTEIQNSKGQKDKNLFNFEEYEKQLRLLAEQKAETQKIAESLERDCIDYVNQNQQLAAILNQKDEVIKILESKLDKLSKNQKNQQQLAQNLKDRDSQIKDLKVKVKGLQYEIKKLRQLLHLKQKQENQNLKYLQNKIAELEAVIDQKQNTIKNLANFNNEICIKILDQKSYSSSSHVKQMQKWLKMLNKKYETQGKDRSIKKIDEVQPNQNYLISQLTHRNQYLSARVIELEKINNKLIKQNTNAISYNEELKKKIKQMQNDLQVREQQKQAFQSMMRKTSFNNTLNFNQTDGGVVYEGTVKIKMEYLLIEKDKRIRGLQAELQDCKNQNIMLRSKIYQLDCEKDFFNETLRNNDQILTLKKARSLGNLAFQNQIKPQATCLNQKRQFTNLINHCNNLTESLGNFIHTCKTDRPSIYDQYQRQTAHQHFGQTQFAVNMNNEKQLQKMRELMNLQKSTFDRLEKNLKNTIFIEEDKWNADRFSTGSRYDKQNINSPIRERNNMLKQKFASSSISRARGTSLYEERM